MSGADASTVGQTAAVLLGRLAHKRKFHKKYLGDEAGDIIRERETLFLYAAACSTVGDPLAASDTVTQFFLECPHPQIMQSLMNTYPGALSGFKSWLEKYPLFAPDVDRIVRDLAMAIVRANRSSDNFFSSPMRSMIFIATHYARTRSG